MSQKRFQVALSFPGEHREYILQVAELLAETLGRDAILYDSWYKAEFTRPNLDTYLQNLYHTESNLLVPFLCADYQDKDWCQLEWRVIRDLIKQKKDDDIMPMRFDNTHISGLFDIDGYMDLNDHEPKEVAELILQRLTFNKRLSPSPTPRNIKEIKETDSPSSLSLKKVRVDRLPTVAGEFFGREAELQLLDDALLNQNEYANTRIIQFIAAGGTGKTKLLRHWLNKREAEINNYIVWSFYSQGTSDSKQVSVTPLFIEAFKAFGIDTNDYTTDEDRADALVDLLTEHKCLLVLDGLEPLQHGGSGFNGQLKDRAMKRLLQRLAQQHSSLCIITTRIHVHELRDRAHVISHPLDNLHTVDGVQLLRSLAVQGGDKELQGAANEVEGHALTLHLLGNAITTYLDGDIRKRDTLEELVDDFDEQGRHAFKVMQGYQHWFTDDNGEPMAELQLLYLLGLFNHPIETAVLQVLWDKQIPGLSAGIRVKAWKVAVRDLCDKHRLLSQHGERPDLLDCHPLIREYFGRQLQKQQPDAWQQAHEALYHYYKALPEDEQPDSLDTMQPLFHAMAHGCAADLYQQVLEEVYWPRIRRYRDNYLCNKLGAFSDDLAVVAHFFNQPWSVLTEGLTKSTQGYLLSEAGYYLRALGRLSEAMEVVQAAVDNAVNEGDFKNAANGEFSMSEIQLALGKIKDAVTSGERSMVYADQAELASWRTISRTVLANALHQAGQPAKAFSLFGEAEHIQKEDQSEYPLLYSLRGFSYCDLLLAEGNSAKVLEQAGQTLEWVIKARQDILSVALNQLSLGCAHHAQNDLLSAHNWLDQAVTGLQEAGSQHHLPCGLLSRAALWRDLDKYELAQQDLAEVWEIAEPSGMRLFMTDYHLEMARLLLKNSTQHTAEEKPTIITHHINEAETLINETGYHRRDDELAALKNESTH